MPSWPARAPDHLGSHHGGLPHSVQHPRRRDAARMDHRQIHASTAVSRSATQNHAIWSRKCAHYLQIPGPSSACSSRCKRCDRPKRPKTSSSASAPKINASHKNPPLVSTQQLALIRKIKARLFMFAILPAFEDLLQFSEPAQSRSQSAALNCASKLRVACVPVYTLPTMPVSMYGSQPLRVISCYTS